MQKVEIAIAVSVSGLVVMALVSCLMLYRLAVRTLACVERNTSVISKISAELLALKAESMTGSMSLSSRILAHNLSAEKIAQVEPDRKQVADTPPDMVAGDVVEDGMMHIAGYEL